MPDLIRDSEGAAQRNSFMILFHDAVVVGVETHAHKTARAHVRQVLYKLIIGYGYVQGSVAQPGISQGCFFSVR